jgi:phosphoribosylaminoimidazole-succinocarboxamide synthase
MNKQESSDKEHFSLKLNTPKQESNYKIILEKYVNNVINITEFEGIGSFYSGKVRDIYQQAQTLLMVATDRQSAFDISWCTIPFKGQILNEIAVWWFEKTKHLVPNHLLDIPDPNVTVCKKLTMFPFEVVVRAYITGSSETSLWVNYQKGIRDFCGNLIPDGLVKNQILPTTIITPTTKSIYDEGISSKNIVSMGLASERQWGEITEKALALFNEGEKIAAERGLILVDTKYEFGTDNDGNILVGDEIHTPDSSRFWFKSTYDKCFKSGCEPDSLDKEFFRLWLIDNGFDPKVGRLSIKPLIDNHIRAKLSVKYIDLFEMITGKEFQIGKNDEYILKRIENNLSKYRLTANK